MGYCGYEQNENNKQKYGNYISAEINIRKFYTNQNIRIINSYEESIKERNLIIESKYENEKEIKENCIIKINNKKIDFNYFYNFKETGKFKLEYIFKNNIKNVNCMFYKCIFLTNIDLSHFNTQYVTDMSFMFYGCESLTNINLSNFNT